jgi:hypothetical protein
VYVYHIFELITTLLLAENMAKFEVPSQNYIHEEIKSNLTARHAWFLTVQNPLPSRLLSNNLKIKEILPVVLYGCESWSLAVREDLRWRLPDSKMLSTNIST